MPLKFIVEYPPDVTPEAAAAISRILAQLLVAFGFAGINKATSRCGSLTYRQGLDLLALTAATTSIEVDIRPAEEPR